MSFNIFLLAILSLLLPISNSNSTSKSIECPSYPQNQICKCHRSKESTERIICCHINSTEEFCLDSDHSKSSVTSLTIQSSELTHLELTYGFISRLGIDPKTLTRLQITQGGSLENVNICSIHQEFISSQDQSNSTLKCQDLVNIEELDLSHNNLRTLDEFYLPKLQKLYLSGSKDWIL